LFKNHGKQQGADRKVYGGKTHPTGCGYSNKLYHPCDYVEPIIDSMRRLNKIPFDTVQRFLRKKASTSVRPPSPVCQHVEYDVDNEGFRVCKHCNVVFARNDLQPDYKEIHSTENSNARADVPKESRRDKFASSPVRDVGSTVSESVKKSMDLGYSTEATKKTNTELSKAENKKLTNVHVKLNDLLITVSPVHDLIRRHIVITADFIFRKGVRHARICGLHDCQRSLIKRPPITIAHSCFLYAVEELSTGSTILNGVTKQEITNIHSKLKNSRYMHSCNTSQNQVCCAVIKVLAQEDVEQACSVIQEMAEPVSRSPKSTKSLPQRDAGVSPVILRVREEVAELTQKFDFEPSVHKAAIFSLTVPRICQAVKYNQEKRKGVGCTQSAYVLLKSLQDEKDSKSGSSSTCTALHDSSYTRSIVQMNGDEVKNLVTAMRGLFTTKVQDVLNDERSQEDDSLYS